MQNYFGLAHYAGEKSQLMECEKPTSPAPLNVGATVAQLKALLSQTNNQMSPLTKSADRKRLAIEQIKNFDKRAEREFLNSHFLSPRSRLKK